MPAKLRFFFLGSLGFVVLAMSWLMFRGHQVNSESQKISTSSTPPSVIAGHSKEVKSKVPTELAEKPGNSQSPAVALETKAMEASLKKKEAEQGSWITPSQITYLDQSPQQKMILDYLKSVGDFKATPKEEPVFIGINDQGLDQFEYDTDDNGHVIQWKRSGDIAVEQIEYPGGDKITRRAPENDRPFTEISYESKANGTFQSVNYRNNGTVESIQDTQGKTTTIYYYDEQGRLTDVYQYAEK